MTRTVMLRHGRSGHDEEGRFTGWTGIDAALVVGGRPKVAGTSNGRHRR